MEEKIRAKIDKDILTLAKNAGVLIPIYVLFDPKKNDTLVQTCYGDEEILADIIYGILKMSPRITNAMTALLENDPD
jgi:hypothetical protein